jgi:hypothetical protein
VLCTPPQPPASAKPEHPESCSPHWWECQQFVRIRHSLDSERAFTRFAEPWGVVARLPWRGATPHAQFLRTRTSGDGYFVTHDRQEEYVPIIEWYAPCALLPPSPMPHAWTSRHTHAHTRPMDARLRIVFAFYVRQNAPWVPSYGSRS